MIRWKKKEKRDWKEGDIRVVRRLLLFPKCLPTHDGVEEWRWFGWCLIKQRIELGSAFTKELGVHYTRRAWIDKEWVDGR